MTSIATGANVLGIDWQTSLADVRKLIPEDIGLQGNFVPSLLSDATPEIVDARNEDDVWKPCAAAPDTFSTSATV